MNNTPSISQRGNSLPSSPIRKLVPFANEAKKKGIQVYHLNIGQPDFLVPQQIKTELTNLVDKVEIIPYAPTSGLEEYLEAWIEYYAKDGITLSKSEIMTTTGGSEALIMALAVLLDPGEEYLVFEPFYANYLGFGNILNLTAKPVLLPKESNYHLPPVEIITAQITDKTKAILLTNPNNPTGTVFTEDELKQILAIAREHNLFVIGDETYRGITFDGMQASSLLQIADKEDLQRVVIVDSLSKRLNICGARLGILISPNLDVMDAVNRFAQARLSVATLEQQMVSPMLREAHDYVSEVAKKYEGRRDAFLVEIEKLMKMKVNYPEGAFYAMLTLPIKDSDDFAKWLLTDFSDNQETVMVAPGGGFYASSDLGKDEVRVAFVLEEVKLRRAAELLVLGLNKYLETS